MILEEINIKNFRAYRDVKVNFSKSKDKNVTLIYGENGTGKTTFFYAINWAFYGRKHDNKEIIPRKIKLDGKYLKEELKEGESTEVSVEIKFSHGRERYTLIRKFKVINRSENLVFGEDRVSLDSYNSSGQSKKYEEAEIERVISSLIPVTSREYFFFDGEKIEKFSDIDNSREIEKSIRDVLGLNTINNAKTYLNLARKYYDKKIDSSNNKSYDENVKLIQRAEDKREEYRKGLEEKDKDLENIIKEVVRITKKLDVFEGEKVQRAELEEIKKNIKEEERIRDEIIQETNQELQKCYSGFSLEIHQQAKKLMDEWDERGVFPSEIFNADLINKTLKKCECLICGTKFKKGSEVYKNVSIKKEEDIFSRDIEKELNSFNGNIKDRISQSKLNLERSNKNYAKYIKKIEQIDKLLSQRDSLKDKISNRITEEEYKKDFDNKHNLETLTIPSIKQELTRLRYNLDDIDKLLEVLNRKKERIKLVSKSDQAFKEKAELCQKAESSTEYLLESYANEKRKEIDKLCESLFMSLVWKESHFKKVELTEDYTLKVFDQYDQPARPDLSAGERQILSLAFITAMAKSANKEIPFIIDTPFGRISKKPREHIANQIPSKVSQLILFVTDTELTEKSEKIFTKKSDKIWTIKFNQKTSISTIVEGKEIE
jgi:DNA sulfur modification protein DndD